MRRDGTARALRTIADFGSWLNRLPHRHKVVIAGNHDWPFQRASYSARLYLGDGRDGVVYLEDSEAEVAGLRIYGSPWQPEFRDWAVRARHASPLRPKPTRDGGNVVYDALTSRGLVTPAHSTVIGSSIASDNQYDQVAMFPKTTKAWLVNTTISVNASVCNEQYQPVNPVQVVELA